MGANAATMTAGGGHIVVVPRGQDRDDGGGFAEAHHAGARLARTSTARLRSPGMADAGRGHPAARAGRARHLIPRYERAPGDRSPPPAYDKAHAGSSERTSIHGSGQGRSGGRSAS